MIRCPVRWRTPRIGLMEWCGQSATARRVGAIWDMCSRTVHRRLGCGIASMAWRSTFRRPNSRKPAREAPTRRLPFCPTRVGAVLHLVPDLRPLLAPGKRAAAGGAGLGRQVRFFDAFGHRRFPPRIKRSSYLGAAKLGVNGLEGSGPAWLGPSRCRRIDRVVGPEVAGVAAF